jgi:hypothetical protein
MQGSFVAGWTASLSRQMIEGRFLTQIDLGDHQGNLAVSDRVVLEAHKRRRFPIHYFAGMRVKHGSKS